MHWGCWFLYINFQFWVTSDSLMHKSAERRVGWRVVVPPFQVRGVCCPYLCRSRCKRPNMTEQFIVQIYFSPNHVMSLCANVVCLNKTIIKCNKIVGLDCIGIIRIFISSCSSSSWNFLSSGNTESPTTALWNNKYFSLVSVAPQFIVSLIASFSAPLIHICLY